MDCQGGDDAQEPRWFSRGLRVEYRRAKKSRKVWVLACPEPSV
ncbi:MAG: hypothetical protein RMM53_03025 [Bacteroidia bacterium]|nr:hypothetical protein [Bacteroidia bacterium]